MDESIEGMAHRLRSDLAQIEQCLRGSMKDRQYDGDEAFPGQHSEMKAQTMLAVRHIARDCKEQYHDRRDAILEIRAERDALREALGIMEQKVIACGQAAAGHGKDGAYGPGGKYDSPQATSVRELRALLSHAGIPLKKGTECES